MVPGAGVCSVHNHLVLVPLQVLREGICYWQGRQAVGRSSGLHWRDSALQGYSWASALWDLKGAQLAAVLLGQYSFSNA